MSPSLQNAVSTTASSLPQRYRDVRALSMAIAAPLSAEDQNVQSMPDASPIKWHLAHTTWFFEKMILSREAAYEPFDARFDAIFNSYYLGLGTPFTRANRGLLTRPGAAEVAAYRAHLAGHTLAVACDVPIWHEGGGRAPQHRRAQWHAAVAAFNQKHGLNPSRPQFVSALVPAHNIDTAVAIMRPPYWSPAPASPVPPAA